MREVCSLIWLALVGAFRSRASLEAENTILRHQLNVLRRQSPKRPTFGMLDRLIFAGLYRLAPKVLGALAIVKPETVIKCHRAGFDSAAARNLSHSVQVSYVRTLFLADTSVVLLA
jgi:hypothetical protein